jgi:hypothetical protein
MARNSSGRVEHSRRGYDSTGLSSVTLTKTIAALEIQSLWIINTTLFADDMKDVHSISDFMLLVFSEHYISMCSMWFVSCRELIPESPLKQDRNLRNLTNRLSITKTDSCDSIKTTSTAQQTNRSNLLVLQRHAWAKMQKWWWWRLSNACQCQVLNRSY